MTSKMHFIFFLLALFLLGCNGSTKFYVKNAGSFNPEVLTVITVDGELVFNQRVKCDNTENGHILFEKKINKGVHLLKVNLPEKEMARAIRFNNPGHQNYIFISMVDNTSKEKYEKGDLKISIAVADKDPL